MRQAIEQIVELQAVDGSFAKAANKLYLTRNIIRLVNNRHIKRDKRLEIRDLFLCKEGSKDMLLLVDYAGYTIFYVAGKEQKVELHAVKIVIMH
jgi:hypothetical protein